VVGLKTPVTPAMTEILSIFTGYDYRSHGVTLKDLGLEDMTRDQIIEVATLGRRER
jgi:hypothetical protein